MSKKDDVVLKERTVEVLEDGSVRMRELVEMTWTQSGRDFITEVRKLENTKEGLLEELKPEAQLRRESDLDKISKDIAELQPYISEVDGVLKSVYEKNKLEGMVKRVKEALGKPLSELNTGYMSAVWENIKENEPVILEALSVEEKQKFAKLKVRALQDKRRAK